MICRACYSADLAPVPFEVPPENGRWFRCAACGSDTAAHAYADVRHTYDDGLAARHRGNIGGWDAARLAVRSNCEWFGHHAAGIPNKDFLDVGCADGSALAEMQAMGYSVHGFDVARPDYYGPRVTVGAVFSRWLFPLRYGFVMCREVIEHVDHPDRMLHELHGVACPGGLVQVQTPKPHDRHHDHVYQTQHLVIISPSQLRRMLAGAMLDVIDAREWTDVQPGQAYLCRARR